ncbi:MAG: hypothetical protein M1444_03075 [Patescibacteria group bacterium]|nr:hypothetical protein [Patescibacteria group bacterium]
MLKNKGLVVAIAVLILALLGGVAYMKFAKSSTAPQQAPTVREQPKTSPSGATGTLKSLFGKNQSCTITYPNNGGSGTIYVSGKKFRGDFTTKIAGEKEVKSQVLSDGTYTYIWSSDSPTGIKMKIDVTSPTASAQTGNFNLDQEVGLNCSPWGVDASKFTVPVNVKFTDMSNLIPKTSALPSTKTETQTQEQSPCDQIADATAKAACEKALSGQ